MHSQPLPQKQQLSDRSLRVDQVASLLSVSDRTVRYWAEIGILPGYKLGRRKWSFRESRILEYVRRRESTDQCDAPPIHPSAAVTT